MVKSWLGPLNTSVEENPPSYLIGFLYIGNGNKCQDKRIGQAREVQRKSRSCIFTLDKKFIRVRQFPTSQWGVFNFYLIKQGVG